MRRLRYDLSTVTQHTLLSTLLCSNSLNIMFSNRLQMTFFIFALKAFFKSMNFNPYFFLCRYAFFFFKEIFVDSFNRLLYPAVDVSRKKTNNPRIFVYMTHPIWPTMFTFVHSKTVTMALLWPVWWQLLF